MPMMAVGGREGEKERRREAVVTVHLPVSLFFSRLLNIMYELGPSTSLLLCLVDLLCLQPPSSLPASYISLIPIHPIIITGYSSPSSSPASYVSLKRIRPTT